ncbi:lipoprotein [Streptomyces sp. OM5714]|nr:lipoprotein [Streptomyces sp. OM5714]
MIAAHPGLAERLGPLREEVVRHAEAFGGERAAASPRASSTASSAASASVSPSVSARAAGPAARDAGAVPADEKGALGMLADAERKLADRRAEALLDVPGETARLLASVAAAGAAHVFLLTEGDG